MDLDPQQLREKALLLLQRERELYELRTKHAGLATWLGLAQSLPQIFTNPQMSLGDIYAQLRATMLRGLRLQRVLLFELEGAWLRPVAPLGSIRPVGQEALAALQEQPAGMVNEQDEGAGSALAEALGLARFIWSRIDVRGRSSIVVAAGYDSAKAKFYPAFDDSAVANLRNTAQHIEGLVGNAVLVSQLQQERDRLQQANLLLRLRDGELHVLAEELRAANETLEQRVANRTAQLVQRNRDMHLVLDNVPMALVTIDPAGRLAEERSAKVDEWFGSYAGSPAFVDYIAASDPGFAAWFALGHEALLDRSLPLGLTLGQLPSRLRSKGRSYRCSYRPIHGAGDEISLLIMIEDVTEQRRLEQEESEQRELLAVCAGLSRDRAGFVAFLEDAGRLVCEIASDDIDQATRLRHLHTLKGNAAVMGVKVMAELCDRAEEELAAEGTGVDEILAYLQQRWSAIFETVEPLLGEKGKNIVEVPSTALERLCDDIERGLSRSEIRRRLLVLTLEPVERPLGRLARHAKALGERLGKPDVTVAIESDGAHLDPHRFGNLWAALIHIVRNAIDHGIEPPAERLARGKVVEGRITLRAAHTRRQLSIEIADDGRGIDWNRVAELARARGMPHEGDAELLRALLSDGFTTRSSASATSGRGVGLSAVHQAVTSLGGTISVRSQAGLGTCWCITLPLLLGDTPMEAQAETG